FLRGRLRDGKGRKVTGLGPDGRGAVEVYDRARAFVVTGETVGTPPEALADLSAVLNVLYDRLTATPPRPARAAGDPPVEAIGLGGEAVEAGGPDAPGLPRGLSDDELLAKARAATNGDAFAAMFDRGDLTDYDGDHSKGDVALCGMLAFWTGKAPAAF